MPASFATKPNTRIAGTTASDIVVDNASASFSTSANWSAGTSAADKYGADYRYRSTAALSDAATWSFSIPATRNYEVYAWWAAGTNRSTTAPYILPNGATVTRNQQTAGGVWNSLGIVSVAGGDRHG